MAGSKNQKMKTLFVLRCLESQTDDAHGVTTGQILEYLDANGIGAERKSIYADIELLRESGVDIITTRNGRSTEYRLGERTFQLAELKLLVDAVGASRFITRKKSLELIKKLEGLTSKYEAGQLRRTVYVDNRIKSMNESIYYSVDAIHTAIGSDHMLRFCYFTYSREKKRVMKRAGAAYRVCPLALTFSDGNYYLYALDPEHGDVRTYRVDRMTDAAVEQERRALPEELQRFDPATHTNEMFSMYGGQRKTVTLSFPDQFATVVIDRFGADVLLVPDGADRFTVTVDVMVSPTFLGWLFGFSGDVIIQSPASVAQEMADMARAVFERYQ